MKLKEIDPSSTPGFSGDKESSLPQLERLARRIGDAQELLYAQNKHKLLVVLQGMDTSGKDGTVKAVFREVNIFGVRVVAFKSPTVHELAHDYLWRVHQEVPRKGEIVIFNRSHYEDVLIVRVHGLVPKEVWRKRYAQINAFEQMLMDEGTTVLKFMLHISKEEQKERLLERLDNPEKRWKFDPGDIDERKLWDDYMEAYQEMLDKTHTNAAPWHVVPANKKWYRNLCIAEVVAETMRKMGLQYPEPHYNVREQKARLEHS